MTFFVLKILTNCKMNELHIKYKSDTGLSPFSEYESELMQEAFEEMMVYECLKGDMLRMIRDDKRYWAVKIDNIKENLINTDDLKLYSKQYVEWLETQINTLLRDGRR